MKPLSKGLLLLATFGLLAVSCMKEPVQEPETLLTGMPSITAVTAAESPATRVSVGEAVDKKRPIIWEDGDALSVFYMNSSNLKYGLKSGAGESRAIFSYVSGFGLGKEFPVVYGAYPYDPEAKYENGALWVTIPAEQDYTEKAFDPKANAMVGVSAPGKDMFFKNVGGYLVLQLFGGMEVSEITVKGANGEKIAGQVLALTDKDAAPGVVNTGEMSEEVNLKCAEPVKVGATEEDATEFWFVLLPLTFENGFTVTVKDADGNVLLERTATGPIEIKRSEVYRMDALEPDAEAAFTAKIVWTYAEDAEADHNIYYETDEGPSVYSRKALPLEFPEGVIEKIGSKLNGATPTSVTVTVKNNADEEVIDEYIKISNFALTEGKLTVDVEDFEWDQTYTVTAEFTGLTLTGTLTTTDRNREAVTLEGYEYTFDINKMDAETGFGYVEQEPVENSYYTWESGDMTADIYKAFLDAGVLSEDDFEDVVSFGTADLADKIQSGDPAGTAQGYVNIDKTQIRLETLKSLTAKVLKEMFNSGEQDSAEPNVFIGKEMTRIFTTYIGQTVIVPVRFHYRVPAYDFLHLKYYTFNVQEEYADFIQKSKFEENDGSVLWWTRVYPSYLIEPADESKSEDEIQQGISYRHALANFDISYINLAELAFNVVDEQDSILEAAQMEDLGLSVKFFYTDETLADKSLPTEDQFVPVFKTYKSLWVDNTVLYYRTNEKKFIPVKGNLTIQSGGCDFPIPTRFDTPKASFLHPDVMLDYSSFAVVRWTPFKEPVAKGSTIVLDENKIYRVPLFKGMELKDNRPQGVSYYVIEDGEWVKGNVTEFDPWSGAPTGGNGYREGVLSKDAYRLTINYDPFLDNAPKELRKLLSLQFSADGETFVEKQNESGTLTPYVVFDYTSEVQFQGTITIPVVVYVESPWQEKLTFEYDVTIKGYNAP